MSQESHCPVCGTSIPHEYKEDGYLPCAGCHALLKMTGLPFFEKIDPTRAPMNVYAQYQKFLDVMAARKLAAARENGNRIIQ